VANYNGISRYAIGTATIKVPFPYGYVKCQYCPFIRADRLLERTICLLTNEYIIDPFSDELHPKCPVVFEESEE
jgi:hypothetical protein